ncbi:MAG: hypothetical protein WA635_08325 [Gallionella sp.]
MLWRDFRIVHCINADLGDLQECAKSRPTGCARIIRDELSYAEIGEVLLSGKVKLVIGKFEPSSSGKMRCCQYGTRLAILNTKW